MLVFAVEVPVVVVPMEVPAEVLAVVQKVVLAVPAEGPMVVLEVLAVAHTVVLEVLVVVRFVASKVPKGCPGLEVLRGFLQKVGRRQKVVVQDCCGAVVPRLGNHHLDLLRRRPNLYLTLAKSQH